MDHYYVKNPVKNSQQWKQNKTGVSRKIVCFGTFIHIFLENNRNTIVFVFITEIFWLTFDVIIDDPYLTF